MSMNQRDQARRFITLVDELYNARCLLVCSAALPPDQLFAGTSGEEPILDLEGLQFEGAVEGEADLANCLPFICCGVSWKRNT
jgi:predicted ATPase